MKNKGFTIVELLAIIVIISIISMITVPIILSVIEDSRKSSFKSSVIKLSGTVDVYIREEETESGSTAERKTFIFPDVNNELNYQGKKMINGSLVYDVNNESYVTNLTDGRYCANGKISNLTIVRGDCGINDKNGPEEIEAIAIKKTTSLIKFLISIEDKDSYVKEIWIKKENESYQKVTIEEKGKYPKKATGIYEYNNLINTKNYTFTVKTIDGKGNENTKQFIESPLKIEAPIITLSNDQLTINPIEATITYPKRKVGEKFEYGYKIYVDGVLKKEEIISDQRYEVDITKKIIVNEEKTTIIAYVSDKVSTAQTQKNVDNYVVTPPTVAYTKNLASPNGTNGWYKSDVTITITGNDGYYGIERYEYSINNGTWQTAVDGKFTISQESLGISFKVRSVSKSTLISTTTPGETIKLDKTPPTLPTINNLYNSTWTSQNVSISIDSSDNISGIAKYRWYNWDISAWVDYANSASNSFAPPTYQAEKDLWLPIHAIDNAGNVSAIAYTSVKIDKTPPYAPYSIFNGVKNTGSCTLISDTCSSLPKDATYNLSCEYRFSGTNCDWSWSIGANDNLSGTGTQVYEGNSTIASNPPKYGNWRYYDKSGNLGPNLYIRFIVNGQ